MKNTHPLKPFRNHVELLIQYKTHCGVENATHRLLHLNRQCNWLSALWIEFVCNHTIVYWLQTIALAYDTHLSHSDSNVACKWLIGWFAIATIESFLLMKSPLVVQHSAQLSSAQLSSASSWLDILLRIQSWLLTRCFEMPFNWLHSIEASSSFCPTLGSASTRG